MFHYAYDGYLNYAYPYDELRPLSCDGVDTWGSYSLTLIDALDTLAIMGNYTEFQRLLKDKVCAITYYPHIIMMQWYFQVIDNQSKFDM